MADDARFGPSNMKRSGEQVSSKPVKNFVRGILGCSCPDEVFETVHIEKNPSWFEGLPGDYLLAIGGRLLVVMINTRPWQAVLQEIAALVLRGREMRDTEGFHRFRLVMVTSDIKAAEATLEEQFNTLPVRDARIHLHIITPEPLQELMSVMDKVNRFP